MMVTLHSWMPSVFPIQTMLYELLYTENLPTLIATYIGALTAQLSKKAVIHALMYKAKMFV